MLGGARLARVGLWGLDFLSFFLFVLFQLISGRKWTKIRLLFGLKKGKESNTFFFISFASF